MKCNLCTGIAHEDEGYQIDGKLVCCGCYEEELFYYRFEEESPEVLLACAMDEFKFEESAT